MKDSKQYLLSSLIAHLNSASHYAWLCENEDNFGLADLQRISLSMSKAQTTLEELHTSVITPANGMDVVS